MAVAVSKAVIVVLNRAKKVVRVCHVINSEKCVFEIFEGSAEALRELAGSADVICNVSSNGDFAGMGAAPKEKVLFEDLDSFNVSIIDNPCDVIVVFGKKAFKA